jgi:hypothetical protein
VNHAGRVLTAAMLGGALLLTAGTAAGASTTVNAGSHNVVAASTVTTPPAASSSPRAIRPVSLHLSPAEQEQWLRLTATPADRARIVAEVQEAFAGVAKVGLSAPSTGAVQPNLATGVTGDHFWITASYADIVDGAIWAGVRACQTRVPAWLCTQAGNLLVSWAAGWGAANDHGVWAAIYWWPPHITGGRW